MTRGVESLSLFHRKTSWFGQALAALSEEKSNE
jgi:hypothetical protein